MEIVANSLSPALFHDLRRGCDLQQLEPELVETALKYSLLTLCAEVDGETVGAVRLVGDGALMTVLCDVMVLPKHRRRGIGGALINAAIEWIAKDMPAGRWVTVMLTCAEERMDYYKKFGFRPFDGDVIDQRAMLTFVKGSGEIQDIDIISDIV
jgi:GNAT superfamily N-acetyltransferase